MVPHMVPIFPKPAWEAALRRNAEPADQRTRHRRRAAWVPVELPGLAAEQTNTPREVVEAALAHTVRNPPEAAYARSDLFERRRLLMSDWASALGNTEHISKQ